jgi:hypothetical protein
MEGNLGYIEPGGGGGVVAGRDVVLVARGGANMEALLGAES